MFTRRQLPVVSPAPRPSSSALLRGPVACRVWCLATLSWLSASCALQVQEGDGLVSDGREILVSASVVPDAGPAANEPKEIEVVPCKAVPLYQQHVAPLFLTKFSSSTEVEMKACIDCHDGSKPKASVALLMTKDRAQDALMCSLTLTVGATKPDKLQAELLLSSDPSRLDVEHDFKFKTMEEYVRWRDEILIWLAAEK